MNCGLDEATLAEIACHANTDLDHVRCTYQSISEELHKKAKIHDFIPLLAMNLVRAHFRQAEPKPSLSVLMIPSQIEKNLNHPDGYMHHYAH
ncbi:MAG: DUF3562 domain-containing protein [Gammaproteobacteria bacterium]|nr:DUF3562 domain-containing protein [Gammaproteobacteria bacterium]